MSSELQLDVRHRIQWRRHLVNAYEGKAGMVNLQVKLLSMSEHLENKLCIKALYKYSSFPFFLTTRARPLKIGLETATSLKSLTFLPLLNDMWNQ